MCPKILAGQGRKWREKERFEALNISVRSKSQWHGIQLLLGDFGHNGILEFSLLGVKPCPVMSNGWWWLGRERLKVREVWGQGVWDRSSTWILLRSPRMMAGPGVSRKPESQSSENGEEWPRVQGMIITKGGRLFSSMPYAWKEHHALISSGKVILVLK